MVNKLNCQISEIENFNKNLTKLELFQNEVFKYIFLVTEF